ncbi:MAG TPA: glycosyltransferase [Chitinophagaceae bacterium]|nr:glycosyltransferase [Chitinophagaceae bacterium]
MRGFSIVICTYNPDRIIFQRLCQAIFSLSIPKDVCIEIIIIDNNGNIPLSTFSWFKNLLQFKPDIKCFVELKPGLTNARIRGYKESSYEWIIFFDDDNEPSPNFLNILNNGLDQYPDLFCTGPGTIEVEYLVKKETRWLELIKERFQERDYKIFSYSNNPEVYETFYPVGTGLVIHKSVMQEYTKRVEIGRYTLSDRKGKSLSSGGDLQILFTGIDMKLKAGVLPGLCLKHLIPPQKTKVKYIEKQIYGTSSTCLLAHDQVFPGFHFRAKVKNSIQIIKFVLPIIFFSIIKNGFKSTRLKVAKIFGDINANIVLQNHQAPLVIKIYEYLIGQ